MKCCLPRKISNTKAHLFHSRNAHSSTDQSLIVHDSQQQTDRTKFYHTTSEKLLEAKRLFSQAFLSCTQNQLTWEQSLKLFNDSYRLYEQIIREINLDTVNLYEYGN